MSQYTPIDLTGFPIADVLDSLSFDDTLLRDRMQLQTFWEARRLQDTSLPPFDTLLLDSDPSSQILRVGAWRDLMLRATINDKVRMLTLAGAAGRYLDHIAMTYFNGTVRLDGEADEQFRARVATQPESRSTCGPEGAYVFWAASASPDVLDVSCVSEDEGICLAPELRLYVLPRDLGTASSTLLNAVQAACRKMDRCPKTDYVRALSAVTLPYTANLTLVVRRLTGSEDIRLASLASVQRFVSGMTRTIDADNEDAGPTYLVGRQIRRSSLMAAAWVDRDAIVDVIIDSPTADINVPAAGWKAGVDAMYGQSGAVPLATDLVQHLWTAPVCSSVTVSVTPASGGY